MTQDISQIKNDYKELRQIERPRKGRKRRHMLGVGHAVGIVKGKRLKKTKKRVIDPLLNIREDKPDLVTTGRSIRVTEVSLKKYGRPYSKFHNPAVAIAEAIQNSMDPEKVRLETPMAVRKLQDMDDEEISQLEATYGKVSDRNGSSQEVNVNFLAVVEEREKAKCYLLPSGWPLWVPKAWIISEGKSSVRVPFFVKRKKVFRLPPKSKTEVKRLLLEHCISKRQGAVQKTVCGKGPTS